MPSTQLFLPTANGLTFAESERFADNRVLRYSAALGEREFWFSFTLTKTGEIARITGGSPDHTLRMIHL